MTVHAKAEDFTSSAVVSAGNALSAGAFEARDASVSGVFETRWATATSEYAIETDGALTRSTATDQLAPLMDHFRPFDPAAASVPTPNYNPYTDMSVNRRERDQLLPEQADPTLPECGASPVEPAGIKAMVEDAAGRYGVDSGFAVAIVATESDFDRDRNSPEGARGPMQLMPATATRFDVSDVCDPASNIDGGVRYLRTLLDEFGNPLLAAAAYNAGERRIYEYGGIPPFAETVSYVAKVVNHQLGLPMPAARTARASRVADDERREVGVIAPKKTGAFVAGVMHF